MKTENPLNLPLKKGDFKYVLNKISVPNDCKPLSEDDIQKETPFFKGGGFVETGGFLMTNTLISLRVFSFSHSLGIWE